jgi:quercetin dioxygenase-like cupin family protein
MELKVDGYTRTVSNHETYQVVAARFPPGSRTSKHRHSVRGRGVLLRGQLVEIKDGVAMDLAEGDPLEENEGESHIVCNLGAVEAVTLTFWFTGGEKDMTMEILPDDEADTAALEDRLALRDDQGS